LINCEPIFVAGNKRELLISQIANNEFFIFPNLSGKMQAHNFLLILASFLVLSNAIGIEVDQINAPPFGTLYTIPNVTLQLGTIDPTTGKITPFGTSYDNLLISEQLTALDYMNQLFYAVILHLPNISLTVPACP
jgi:hypothetical protein